MADIWIRQLKTLRKMLADRNYKFAFEDNAYTSPGDIPFRVIGKGEDAKGNSFICTVSGEPKVGVKTLRRLKDEADQREAANVMLICEDGLTPFASKELNHRSDKLDVEILRLSDLSYNVTEHSLVPTHTLLTPTERKDLLTRLKCTSGALPKLKESDPIARYYRYLRGSIIRIDRRSFGSLERQTYYRVVT